MTTLDFTIEFDNNKHSLQLKEERTLGTKRIFELKGVKSNLIELDGMTVKPKRVELFSSGNAILGYSCRKGKSWGQNVYFVDVKLNK